MSKKYGKTPLHFAVENGHIECVQYLLDKGANLDDQDSVRTKCYFDKYIILIHKKYIILS